MAVELTASTLHEERLDGQDQFVLADGQKLRIQKKIGGEWEDVFAAQTVPNGKQWNATVVVRILAQDA
jgi:hypothetical protein